MKKVSVKASTREINISADVTRKEGLVPGVIYGGAENLHVKAHVNDLRKATHTSEFNIVEIEINGKKIDTILKDAQYHPITDEILHFDLLELVKGHMIKAQIPVRLVGNSKGVKLGGKLVQKVRKVQVKVAPENLVGELTIDVSNLDLGNSGRVKDIVVAQGIQVMTPSATPVCTVEIPRALKSAAAAEKASAGKK